MNAAISNLKASLLTLSAALAGSLIGVPVAHAASPALVDGSAWIAPVQAPRVDGCDSSTVDAVVFPATLEYQLGPAAWVTAGTWDICVKNGGNAEFIVNFADSSYQIRLNVTGERTPAETSTSPDSWTFGISRQDFEFDHAITTSSEPLPFNLGKGETFQSVLKGKYHHQGRNLRLTFDRR
jgi:hypothetical protein